LYVQISNALIRGVVVGKVICLAGQARSGVFSGARPRMRIPELITGQAFEISGFSWCDRMGATRAVLLPAC